MRKARFNKHQIIVLPNSVEASHTVKNVYRKAVISGSQLLHLEAK